jgi:hypothetical protein
MVLNQLSTRITSPLPSTAHSFRPHTVLAMYIWPHYQKEGLRLKYMKPYTECGGAASFIGDRLCDFSHGGWQACNAKSGADMVAPCVKAYGSGYGSDSQGTTPRRGKGFSSSLPREDRFWTRPSLLCNHYQELSTGIMRQEWQNDEHLPFVASHALPRTGYLLHGVGLR